MTVSATDPADWNRFSSKTTSCFSAAWTTVSSPIGNGAWDLKWRWKQPLLLQCLKLIRAVIARSQTDKKSKSRKRKKKKRLREDEILCGGSNPHSLCVVLCRMMKAEVEEKRSSPQVLFLLSDLNWRRCCSSDEEEGGCSNSLSGRKRHIWRLKVLCS